MKSAAHLTRVASCSLPPRLSGVSPCYVAQAFQPAVPQVFNLHAFGGLQQSADWKSAIQQAESLRYAARLVQHLRAVKYPGSAVFTWRSKPLKRGVNDTVFRLNSAGFTLAEVLAALLFMAIVIPVAVQGLQVANRAGEVAERKSQAARIAERVLNENIVTTNWTQSSSAGTLYEGSREFHWTLRSEPWSQNLTNQVPAQAASMGQLLAGQPQVTATAASQTTLNLLSVEVTYKVQERDYILRLSTLINSLQ